MLDFPDEASTSAKLNKFLAAFEIDLYDLMVFGFA